MEEWQLKRNDFPEFGPWDNVILNFLKDSVPFEKCNTSFRTSFLENSHTHSICIQCQARVLSLNELVISSQENRNVLSISNRRNWIKRIGCTDSGRDRKTKQKGAGGAQRRGCDGVTTRMRGRSGPGLEPSKLSRAGVSSGTLGPRLCCYWGHHRNQKPEDIRLSLLLSFEYLTRVFHPQKHQMSLVRKPETT